VKVADRIAFDARYTNDRYHGIGRFAFRLLEALTNIAPESNFIVFRGKEPDSRFDWRQLSERPNVEIHNGPWPLYRPQEQLEWYKILRRSRADIFFSPYFPTPLLVNLPLVITVHDLIFERYPAYMPWGWARPYYRLMMTLSTHRARRIIAVSQATALDLSRFYKIPKEKIAVISEGVDANFSPLEDEQLRRLLKEKYGLVEPFILSVGVRRPHKNLVTLVHAFANLATSIPHQLVFIGTADPRFPDEARNAANQRQIDGRTRFLGWVSEADLPGLYSLASVFVIPSLVEGFGLPALEAMACGTPVLAANTFSLPEIVGEAAMLVDPNDQDAMTQTLQSILCDERLRQELTYAGRKRAAQFTWDNTARRALNLFNEALK